MSSDDLISLIEKWGKYVGFLAAIGGLISLAVNNKIVAVVLLTVGGVLLEFWFRTMWHQSPSMRKAILKGEPPPSKIYTDKQRKAGQVFFYLTPFAYLVLLVFMMNPDLPAALEPTTFPATATLTPVPTNTVIPTVTPITAGAPPCLIDMRSDLIFADLNEIYAVIRNGALEIEPRFLDRYIALDSGCKPLSFFTVVATAKLESGSPANGFCVAFGPEPPEAGILKSNYAFCIDGNKNWLIGVPKGEEFQPSQKNTTENLMPMGAENMLIVQHTPEGISFRVNGAPVGASIPEGAIKGENYYFGFGLGTSTELPRWLLTALKVYQYDPTQQSKSSPWHGFSNLEQSRQGTSSLVLVGLKKQQTNLALSRPAVLNYPVATYILMDTSASMVFNDKSNLGQALTRMILEVAPPDDMLGLGLFGDKVTVIFPPDTHILDLQHLTYIENMIAEGFQIPAQTTNYFDAFQHAISELNQVPIDINRRIVLITDGAFDNLSAQNNDLSKVYLEAKQKGIDIDVILIGNQISDDFLTRWKSFEALSIANHLFMVNNIGEVPGIILKQYYYSHSYDNSDNHVLLRAPGEYTFEVKPNVEKMAMTFEYADNPDQQVDVSVVPPDVTNYEMKYSNGIFSFSNPPSGQWKIILKGNSAREVIVQSLFLVSVPSK